MSRTLGFRLGRRLVAAALIDDETVEFRDCHYVSSRPTTRENGLTKYFERLIQQCTPALIAVYAPTAADTPTERLVTLLSELATGAGVPFLRLQKPEIFAAIGAVPVRTRAQLQAHVAEIWTQLPDETPVRRLPLAEAVAAALLADVHQALIVRRA